MFCVSRDLAHDNMHEHHRQPGVGSIELRAGPHVHKDLEGDGLRGYVRSIRHQESHGIRADVSIGA
jgi:hypothetical protein